MVFVLQAFIKSLMVLTVFSWVSKTELVRGKPELFTGFSLKKAINKSNISSS